jgi:hypothetical protein
MIKTITAILGMVAIAQGANAAQIVTVDFAPGSYAAATPTSPISSKGFFFQTSGSVVDGELTGDPGAGIVIYRANKRAPGFEDARAFRLISATFTAPAGQQFSVFGSGYQAGGGSGEGTRFTYSGPSGTITSGSDAYGYLNISADANFPIHLDNFVFAMVPEPETWAIMIVGFGVAGISARKRRARNAISATA